MRLTIIREDGSVYKDGVSFAGLDLSTTPIDVHALQWYETAGWIEFVNESEFKRPPNENITELPSWANDALAQWQIAYEASIAPPTPAPNQPTVDGAQTL
jgi:hypothetical protein